MLRGFLLVLSYFLIFRILSRKKGMLRKRLFLIFCARLIFLMQEIFAFFLFFFKEKEGNQGEISSTK